ncbi:hypothetical protein ACFXK0_06690 [Nocardia sp. NPDC059177]|uniref:hypothetical protein n=1 Tax=Nocardia sp. NPDC059177 TaxID=3346759 RepID=UPI0036835911
MDATSLPHPHEHIFPDTERTTRSHAGESIQDSLNWPGLLFVGFGIVLLAATLTAAGYGFAGWAVIAGVLCGVCMLVGIGIVLAEHRRIKVHEGLHLTDPCGH